MNELESLPNIGAVVARQLEQAGITSCEELRQAGAEGAWLRIQALDPSACIHRLLALEGAIRGVKKTLLPAERRAELKEFYLSHKL